MSRGRTSSKTQSLKLQLFVAGQSPNSVAAVRHLCAVLSAYPSIPVDLEILDVLEHPELGEREEVLVTPTLMKLAPAPRRRIIGSLKDTDIVVSALGLADARRE